MSRPRVALLGASGFIGGHLLASLREDCEVVALARSSREAIGLPEHPSVTWLQVDIRDRAAVDDAFEAIARSGGVDIVLHLAAHYDFTGVDHPDYRRTNVDGLRHVLDASRQLRPRLFAFASSLAACDFPPPGAVLTESSPADGPHAYAASKRVGEAMLRAYRDDIPAVSVRMAAVFSDWCEYPALWVSLERWRSATWTRRILGGHGLFAIPYIHVQDVVAFFRRLIDRAERLDHADVLIASPDEAVTLRELYTRWTLELDDAPQAPLVVPRAIVALGLSARALAGALAGRPPFERPWMARYIDRQMKVDAHRTRERLDWSARPRLGLPDRLSFLLDRMRGEALEWELRNRAMLERRRYRLPQDAGRSVAL